jgi:hypothetical protein
MIPQHHGQSLYGIKVWMGWCVDLAISKDQPIRGFSHYGNWGSMMWTIVPATFQSKCLHLITLPMVMYHTTGSLAPQIEACDETVRNFSK